MLHPAAPDAMSESEEAAGLSAPAADPAFTATGPVEPEAPKFRARHVLMRRLADVVCLPESRINAFERAVTADLLVEMLREAEPADRVRVARRLSILAEVPNSLVRLLIVDEDGKSFLVDAKRRTSTPVATH